MAQPAVSFDPRALAATYDRIAGEWLEAHVADSWWVPGATRFDALVAAGPILDVGCGCGFEARFYSDRGREVVGVDFSSEQLRLARQRVPGATFHQLDLFDLPTMDRKFPGVQAQAVLLHVPKALWPRAIAALRSVLLPGGWMFVTVKERYTDQVGEEIKIEERFSQRIERFFSYFTAEELRKIFEEQGLEEVSVTTTPSARTNWLQVLARQPR